MQPPNNSALLLPYIAVPKIQSPRPSSAHQPGAAVTTASTPAISRHLFHATSLPPSKSPSPWDTGTPDLNPLPIPHVDYQPIARITPAVTHTQNTRNTDHIVTAPAPAAPTPVPSDPPAGANPPIHAIHPIPVAGISNTAHTTAPTPPPKYPPPRTAPVAVPPPGSYAGCVGHPARGTAG
jgi:hypothetical protein